ncbi:MAG: carbon starvation protein A [Acidobacteria bacterium]|nr:carbon starvation protein A [Acidobacteriota bacterium]
MDARALLLVVIALLGVGYLVYGRLVARLLGIDPSRPTPAHTKYDGVDYVPARQWLVLFGHHFSSICAAGPIVGPALAVAYWGWAPSIVWIVLGGVLMGAVADFSSLVVAVRHGGVSIAEVSGRVVTRRARTLFSVFILIALVLVLAVFTVLTAGTFVQAPEIVVPSWGILPVAALAGVALYRGRSGGGRLALVTIGGLGAIVALLALGHAFPPPVPHVAGLAPQTFWALALLVYCLVASVLPVQYLLQPRDYLSSYVLFTTIGLGLVGILVSGPAFQAAPFHGFQPAEWPLAGPLWPLMFVTIACGAISGFHSVVSSGTTCKQLDNEAHACRIGYGAMIMESTVATLVVIAVGAGLSAARHAELLRAPGGAIAAFGEGYGSLTGSMLGGYGTTFALMALNFFILTTLDTATRLGRYLLAELTGWESRWAPAIIVVVAAGALALSDQWRVLWPAFGASNQLVAALALLVVSCWLVDRGKARRVTLVPALVMLVTTIGALVWQVHGAVTGVGREGPDWFLAGLCAILIVLAVAVSFEARVALRTPPRPARASS